MTYQSFYRRFRPQRFDEVLGQEHVTTALGNAVRTNKVAHAYLFSGPRGCGKTTSARILAKALNCTDLQDGEPCGACESCQLVVSGASMDVIEMDAASNNGVDAMRDLVSRAALGTAGRRKVYIIDEVHMLSTAASNALLKTLEEPPEHVVFVLATTDPQKVLPTIRSRTQHFEIRLLSHALLVQLIRDVLAKSGIELDDATIDAVAKRGNGSARDALSMLDQVVAAGGIDDAFDFSVLLSALADREAFAVLTAVDDAVNRGRDARQLAKDLTESLREVFLAQMGLSRPGVDEALLRKFPPAAVTRALELLGETLVAMRDALEPRVLLETSLMRLVRVDLDTSPAALAERLERVERAIASGTQVAAGTQVAESLASPPIAARPSAKTEPASNAEPIAPTPETLEPTSEAAPPASPAPSPTPRPATPRATPPADGLPPLRMPETERPVAAAPSGRKGGAADEGRAKLANLRGGSAAAAAVARPAPKPIADEPRAVESGHPSRDVARAAPVEREPEATSSDGPLDAAALLGTGREVVLERLERKAKIVLTAGRFLSVDGDVFSYGLPNQMHLSRCVEWNDAFAKTVSATLGRDVRVDFVVDPQGANPAFGPEPADDAPGQARGRPGTIPGRPDLRAVPPLPEVDEPEADEDVDLGALVDATDDHPRSTLEVLTRVFPGAELIDDPRPRPSRP